ncbi:MAG: ribose 5-phosphate isomerase B [Candidatus Saganbacteria bacterium]|nr:ribose 5-phosphate isomerase B [Candidatus Saganbacteria bacterium]
MKIAVGADHKGFKLKQKIVKILEDKGHEAKDFGTKKEESCDYPPIAYEVAKSVSMGQSERGILICDTGIGMTIAANKVKGVRAGLANTVEKVRLCREHNDCNVLSLSTMDVDQNKLPEIIDMFLTTEALGERHARRVGEIKDIEKQEFK